jgi:hypothetical protein
MPCCDGRSDQRKVGRGKAGIRDQTELEKLARFSLACLAILLNTGLVEERKVDLTLVAQVSGFGDQGTEN